MPDVRSAETRLEGYLWCRNVPKRIDEARKHYSARENREIYGILKMPGTDNSPPLVRKPETPATEKYLKEYADEQDRVLEIQKRTEELLAERDFQREVLDGRVLFGIDGYVVHVFRGHFRRANIVDWLKDDPTRSQVTHDTAYAIWAFARVDHQ